MSTAWLKVSERALLGFDASGRSTGSLPRPEARLARLNLSATANMPVSNPHKAATFEHVVPIRPSDSSL